MNMFFVYILKSIRFNKYYVGQTKDLQKRIEHHNSNRARWTKRYQPWEIVYIEECLTRSDAMKKEKKLKQTKNLAEFLEKILIDSTR
jgi:putative endonuclease